jgi:hypothetical protein
MGLFVLRGSSCVLMPGVGVPDSEVKNKVRTIDLDVDIGADAVDYKSADSV